MKNKKLLQKAGSWILSAALAVSCLSGIPAATATAAVDVSNWQKEIYVDFGTGLNGTGSADTDLAENILLAQDMKYTCNGTLIAGYGTWLYDSTDVGTVHGGAATNQKIGFDRVLPAGVVTVGNPGAYFRDWVFSPDGKEYKFSVDLPVGQYYVYVYTGNKTGGYDNISKVAFSDNNYQVIYDQTSVGGGQYKVPGCVYVVNVDEKTPGCGYGTASVKIFDDTIVTSDDGYDAKYDSTNTVFYNQDSNVTFTSNDTTIANGKIVTARLNGIEFLPVENAAKAERVTATEASTNISIETEQTKTLSATTSPETATERIEYFSSDEEIVKVDPRTGEITGVATGTATVTATTPSLIGDASKSVTYNITVYEVTSLELDPTSLSLELDPTTGTASGTVTAKFDAKNLTEAQNALNQSVTSSIATVTFGDVTETEEPADGAKGKYSQPITITANDKGTETLTIARTTGREASLNLTVTKPVTSVAFYDADEAVTDKYSMVAGTTLTVKAKGLPEGASSTGVRYSFKETTDIATITTTGGRITAKKSGTAVIVAASTSKPGITAQATLTITPGFTISYPDTGITMTAGQTSKNEPTISYKDDVNQSLLNTKVTYSSDNEKVAKVDKDNGTVSALAVGTANITATAEDGGQTASYKVTVNAAAIPAEGINVKNKNITLDLSVKSKKTAKINASLVPDTSTDTLSSYSVPKNCKVIKVDDKGQVTALKPGSATVTVKSSNNISTTVKVTVKASATKVKVSGKNVKKNKVTLKKGKTLKLTAKVTPSNSTDKVKWSTKNKKVATVKKTKKGATITAKKKGKAKIIAKAGKKSVTITVTVK